MEKNFEVTLTLIRQCPMSNSSELFYILQYVQASIGLMHYFWSYRVLRQTDTHPDRHTDGHEYSIVEVDKPQIVAVDKPQLY